MRRKVIWSGLESGRGIVVGVFCVAVAAIAMDRASETAHAQSFYAGPSYNGTSGYITPDFHHDEFLFVPEASWQLLNDAGMAAWHSTYLPQTANYNAIRFHPPTGPPVQLQDPVTGESVYPTSNPYAINASGTIVGRGRNSFNHDVPVKWSAGGTSATILETLSTYNTLPPRPGQANDINDAGVAVGWSGLFHPTILIDLGDRAVRWDAAGNVSELGQISYHTVPCGEGFCSIAYSEAYAINNSSVAVGRADVYDSEDVYDGDRAVRWDAAGVPTQLGHLGSEDSPNSADTRSAAWAVNGAGDAVGYARKYVGGAFKGYRAVRWNHDSTAAIELQILAADQSSVADNKVFTLNESGTAVGYSGGDAGGLRAVRWDSAGQVTALESLQANNNSAAIDINDHGVAAGWAEIPGGRRAVLWEADGSVFNLNNFLAPGSGWQLTEALAISNTGWIAGIGNYDPDGEFTGQDPYVRAFMLQLPTEVPLAGDYNDNGAVDAADYVLWRKSYNSGSILPNDQSPGWVSDDDYRLWESHFGETLNDGSGAVGAVPEPATTSLLAIAAFFLVGRAQVIRIRYVL